MKLTKREKILMIILASFLLLFLSYKYIYSPQVQAVANMKNKVMEYQQKVDKVETQLVSKTNLQEEYKFANARVRAIISRYVPEIIQEKLIEALDKIISASGVEIDTITYEDINIVDLNESADNASISPEKTLLEELKKQYGLQEDKAKEKKEKVVDHSLKVVNLKADITFYSNYNEAINFLKLLESYERKIVIESFSLNHTISQYGNIKGNVKIIFYTLPQLDESSIEDYNQWDINNIYGRDNPFAPFEGYTGSVGLIQNGGNSNSSINEIKFNFTMAVSPIMSDMPSVFIGRNDSGSSYVYADNERFEDVEIQLQKKDEKYYCKYRTEKHSYPEAYNDSWVEFTPASQGINLQIVSAKRTSSADKTGVNLSLINNTDLPLRVFIKDDDINISRIKMVKQEGNVYITK